MVKSEDRGFSPLECAKARIERAVGHYIANWFDSHTRTVLQEEIIAEFNKHGISVVK